jgi:16S rRNA (cytosine967-C5)-methyltransferase
LREEWLARGYAPAGEDGFTSFGLERAREGASSEQAALEQLEEQGALSRQGISSQLVAEHIARLIRNSETLAQSELWDACCGRGGKSTALLEKGVRVTLASDPAQFRVDELLASVRRLGLPEPKVVCAPEQDVHAAYPLILLDVPCSGTGTLGRVPELRIRLTPEKLNEAERLQAEILEDAWECLLPGGMLFYVTCALNRKENEGRIAKFLAEHGAEHGGDASLVEQRLFLPSLPGHDALFLAVLNKS